MHFVWERQQELHEKLAEIAGDLCYLTKPVKRHPSVFDSMREIRQWQHARDMKKRSLIAVKTLRYQHIKKQLT